MKTKILTLIQLFISVMLFSQTPVKQNTTIVNSYEQKTEGVDFLYHSSIPIAKESMLIRATDGTSTM